MISGFALAEPTAQGGYSNGTEYQSWGSSQKLHYAIGFINGLLVAPFMGADNAQTIWLDRCVENMRGTQVVAILDKYLAENPAKWHFPLNILSLSAMESACREQ